MFWSHLLHTSNYYLLKLFKRLHGLNCILHAVQVPRESLLFLISSFGGQASWDGNGAPFKESDEDITHQVNKNFEILLLLFIFCTFFDTKVFKENGIHFLFPDCWQTYSGSHVSIKGVYPATMGIWLYK